MSVNTTRVPCPSEPGAVGAVIEDGQGNVWVRVYGHGGPAPWRLSEERFPRSTAEPWSVWSAIPAPTFRRVPVAEPRPECSGECELLPTCPEHGWKPWIEEAESAPVADEREALAAAIIDHQNPQINALTKPEDSLTMVRTDPAFFICAKALALADAVLAEGWARRAPVADALAAVRALLRAEPCYITRDRVVRCDALVGGTFPNGAEFDSSLCCLPCRALAAIDDVTSETGGGSGE